ncbi:MAG: hypothetical protein ABEI58_02905 [Candidatus Nanohaloarchaea archaeon]
MTLAYFAGGFLLGFLVGVGAALLYLRWQMKRQIGNLEEQMDALMTAGDEMTEELGLDEVEGPEADAEEESGKEG